MARLTRLSIGILLAVCGCLLGCDGVTSLRVGLTGDPLGLVLEIKGKQAPVGPLNVTTDAAATLPAVTMPASP